MKYSTLKPEYVSLDFVRNFIDFSKYVVVDKNVKKLYFENLDCFEIEAIEKNKTLETCEDLCEWLSSKQFRKNDTILAIGGGITQDIVGFTSHIYKRGVRWIYFPTTLLAMLDSCVGGKTGINSRGAKNQIGVFSFPTNIYTCSEFLKTLSEDQIDCGIGEKIKIELIGGNKVEPISCINSHQEFIPIIKKCIEFKKDILSVDMYESNERKILNYGHSVGHVLESISDYEIPHGQAVIFGMKIINDFLKDIINNEFYDYCEKVFEPYIKKYKNKFSTCEFTYDMFKSLLRKDKKNIDDNINLVFLRNFKNYMVSYKTQDTKKLFEITRETIC